MTEDLGRKGLNESAQPKAWPQGEFSAQPKVEETMKKSLQPLSGSPPKGTEGVGASTQPKAPLTTQSAKPPPPSGDD